jgi:hypothetical protein
MPLDDEVSVLEERPHDLYNGWRHLGGELIKVLQNMQSRRGHLRLGGQQQHRLHGPQEERVENGLCQVREDVLVEEGT